MVSHSFCHTCDSLLTLIVSIVLIFRHTRTSPRYKANYRPQWRKHLGLVRNRHSTCGRRTAAIHSRKRGCTRCILCQPEMAIQDNGHRFLDSIPYSCARDEAREPQISVAVPTAAKVDACAANGSIKSWFRSGGSIRGRKLWSHNVTARQRKEWNWVEG